MDLLHFSHDHPLIFNKVSKGHFWCDGCGEEIKGSRYSCSKCNFDLHKSCAELPLELQHPIHLEHPLILHKTPPYNGKTCTCKGCKSPCKWFVYHCSLCKFDLDVKCVSLPLTIKTEIHEHPSKEKDPIKPTPAILKDEDSRLDKFTNKPSYVVKKTKVREGNIERESKEKHPIEPTPAILKDEDSRLDKFTNKPSCVVKKTKVREGNIEIAIDIKLFSNDL